MILALAIPGSRGVVRANVAAQPGQAPPAGEPPAPDGASEPAPEAPEEPQAEKKKKKKDDDPIRFKGRVLVRNTISTENWTNDLDLDQARFAVVYRNREHGLRVELEAELAGRSAEVRDAYIRLDPNDHVRIQAGNFKRPISTIALASRWDLPVIERGYLSDLELANGVARESDELPLGGRAVGITTTLRDDELPGQPALVIGVFRSLVHDQVAPTVGSTPPGWSNTFPEDVYTRLEVEPMQGLDLAVSVAAVGQLDSAGDGSTFRHGFVTGLDAMVEMGMFRGWFEVFMGASPLHISVDGDGNPVTRGQFQAVRGIASARVPVTATMYVEPYAAFQLLNSSNQLDNDRIMQGGGGINLGVGESWRVQTAVDRASVDSNPLLLYESATLFIVQLGAVF